MDRFINFKLLASPLNWVVIITMLILSGIAGHLALQLAGKSAAKAPPVLAGAGEQERLLAAQSVLG